MAYPTNCVLDTLSPMSTPSQTTATFFMQPVTLNMRLLVRRMARNDVTFTAALDTASSASSPGFSLAMAHPYLARPAPSEGTAAAASMTPVGSPTNNSTSAALYLRWPMSTCTSTHRSASSTALAVNARKPTRSNVAVPTSMMAVRLVPRVMATMARNTGILKRSRRPASSMHSVMAGTIALSIWMKVMDRRRYDQFPSQSVPAKLSAHGSTLRVNIRSVGGGPNLSRPAQDSRTPADAETICSAAVSAKGK
mmetsp:Transcript_7674/g.22712  ORF Transcript_7674/g.22712 Transcript_7674/m.22712 type:complete len:252 (-) Transcript_7674:1290-2045(-)